MYLLADQLSDDTTRHRVYVNAVEIEDSLASPDDGLTLSVEFVVYHKICTEATGVELLKGDLVAVLVHRCFDAENAAASTIFDMVAALELPTWLDGKHATAGKGVGDVADRVLEIVRRRTARQVGVVMVVETVLPQWPCVYGNSSAAAAA